MRGGVREEEVLRGVTWSKGGESVEVCNERRRKCREGNEGWTMAPTIHILPYFHEFSCQNMDYGILQAYTDLLTEQTMIVLTAQIAATCSIYRLT